MDNLVLIRVAAGLDRTLAGAVLGDLREEGGHRFRLVFERGDRSSALLVSLASGEPWLGRPSGRSPDESQSAGPFAARCRRALGGSVLAAVSKAADRCVTLRFAGGEALVAELIPQRPNLILLDAAGRVSGSARLPPSSRARLAPGACYVPPSAPPGRLDARASGPDRIDEEVARRGAEGASPAEALARCVLGISGAAAGLIVVESVRSGASVGTVLVSRIEALARGELDPVVQVSGEGDPRLLPWDPGESSLPDGVRLVRFAEPAATAGSYHEAVEQAHRDRARAAALLELLEREIGRLSRARAKVVEDLAAFESPERYRLWGEALLAGLATARQSAGAAQVPDPYDADGRVLSIPVPPGRSLVQAAQSYFEQHRRARRGLDQARRRMAALDARKRRLEELASRHAGETDAAAMAELARSMLREGIPVGLERSRPAARGVPASPSPRLEGVRVLAGADGRSILVGKGGKDNDRLTFKLAGPDDFWFHALGVSGAHVVVRNDERQPRPPPPVLADAAAAAAWYSDARAQPLADVQWTRRKYVRRLRGAPPGTVRVKRSETVRVRPGLPRSSSDGLQVRTESVDPPRGLP